MGDGTYIVAVTSVIVAVLGMVGGTAWLNRRNVARLTQAQATTEDAKTAEMIDKMARDWLERLDKELADERTIRIYSIAYIERLLTAWKNTHPESVGLIPPLPDQLVEYLGKGTSS